MIRINLLPYRDSKKQETASQQLVIMALTILIAFGIVGAVYVITLGKISTTKSEITKSEDELANLKKKIGEIDNLKKLQAEVQKKLDILNQLRKEKTGPAIRLARMSDIVPEKMWLTRYQETGTRSFNIRTCLHRRAYSRFHAQHQASQEFANVELQVSEQQEINGIKLKKFDLTCSIKAAIKEEPKKEPEKK